MTDDLPQHADDALLVLSASDRPTEELEAHRLRLTGEVEAIAAQLTGGPPADAGPTYAKWRKGAHWARTYKLQALRAVKAELHRRHAAALEARRAARADAVAPLARDLLRKLDEYRLDDPELEAIADRLRAALTAQPE